MSSVTTVIKLLLLAICLTPMKNLNAASYTAITYKTIRIDGVDIFYREAGAANAPVLLLLHGVPTSSRMYQPMLGSVLNTKYRLIAPDYPGFGHSSWPDPKDFAYTFDHIAQIMQDFADQLELTHYTLLLHDYGGPIGMRMAAAHPEKVQALIIQNAVSHEEGLSPIWASRKEFWRDRAGRETDMRKGFLSLESTRNRHLGSSPHPEKIDPDTWVDEYYFLNQPRQGDIQMDLFYDYQTNLKAYPSWQKWLRDHQPPMLVLWGKFDPSFTVAGAQAYQRDVQSAEVHLLEAGHFALDEKPDEIIALTDAFMSKQTKK
jgi:pimeloyl-ACP methyl ester carboxylesterase